MSPFTHLGAERALKEVITYRNSLDKRADKDLIIALDRVVDVVQNHLYHAYLGKHMSSSLKYPFITCI